jgi:DNA primase
MQINAKECPHCGDRRWRVYLNAATGLGNCFVCNEPFNKIKFAKLVTDLPWRELKTRLVEIMKDQGWRPKRVSAAVEVGEVKLPLSFALPTPEGSNLMYLEERGVDSELAAYFHLRFSEDGWWNFTKEDGSSSGQHFGNRVIIPVFDLDGTLKTFQGRDITGTSERKYLFPAMLPGTGKFLYNGQNAVRAKRVVVGEGVFDVIALKKAFDEDVELRDVVPVGTFGKHLSFGSMDGDDQLGRFMQLKAFGLKEVTFLWDGEKAALESALSAAELLHRNGFQVRVGLLPEGRDPNESTAEDVRKAFWSAQTYSPRLAIQWRLRNPYKK